MQIRDFIKSNNIVIIRVFSTKVLDNLIKIVVTGKIKLKKNILRFL